MTPKQLEQLSVASELAYQRSLRDLAPIEAERRRLETLRSKAMADARAMFAARIETPLAAADLAAEAASQHEARQRAARIDKALAILAPRIVGAREGVHRALARCEVVSKLKERATAEIDREPDEAT